MSDNKSDKSQGKKAPAKQLTLKDLQAQFETRLEELTASFDKKSEDLGTALGATREALGETRTALSKSFELVKDLADKVSALQDTPAAPASPDGDLIDQVEALEKRLNQLEVVKPAALRKLSYDDVTGIIAKARTTQFEVLETFQQAQYRIPKGTVLRVGQMPIMPELVRSGLMVGLVETAKEEAKERQIAIANRRQEEVVAAQAAEKASEAAAASAALAKQAQDQLASAQAGTAAAVEG